MFKIEENNAIWFEKLGPQIYTSEIIFLSVYWSLRVIHAERLVSKHGVLDKHRIL